MPPTTLAPSRVVGGPLMLSLLALPIVFVWFLLRPGYSSGLRKAAFAYAFFLPAAGLVVAVLEWGLATLGGLADRDRVAMIDLGDDGVASIISVEDIIADRMGQYASGTAPEMIEQVYRLFSLHDRIDRAYLDRRTREETLGDYGIDDIKADPA